MDFSKALEALKAGTKVRRHSLPIKHFFEILPIQQMDLSFKRVLLITTITDTGNFSENYTLTDDDIFSDDWKIIEDTPEQPLTPKTHGINSYSLWLNNKISEYNSAIQSCIECREYDRAAVLAKERDGFKMCLSAFEKMVV